MIRVIIYEPSIKVEKIKKEVIRTIIKKDAKEVKRIAVMDSVFRRNVNATDQDLIHSKQYMVIDKDYYESLVSEENKGLLEELKELKKEDLVAKAKKLEVKIDATATKESIIDEIVKEKGSKIEIPNIEDFKEI